MTDNPTPRPPKRPAPQNSAGTHGGYRTVRSDTQGAQRLQRQPGNASQQVRPSRPQAAKASGRGTARVQPSPSANRNMILAAVLLILVTVCVVIFAVQSCTKKGGDPDSTATRDSVKLNTPVNNASSDDEPKGMYAEYTDDSGQLNITSEYGILIDLEKNKVIASKNGDEKIYPASMTKVMTLIVAMENIEDLDDTYKFTSALLDPLYVQNASVAGFSPEESVPLRDIIYGCILPSGADCTSALAEYVAGSEEEFAHMMNKKAEALGLKNTHFVTASGLHDDDHYSTCHDMAVILRYALKNDKMREVLSTYRYTTSKTDKHPDGITLKSTLLSRMNGDEAEGVFVQGGKTGYTPEAKNCLASFAANCTEEMASSVQPQYILVTAYASGEYTPVYDAIAAYSEFCS